MSGFSLRVHKNDLGALAAALPGRVSQVNRKTAFDIMADTAAATPVATGNLRGSWSVGHAEHVQEERGTAVEVGSAVDYARFVEEGTRDRPGHFMLRRAAETHRGPHRQALQQVLGP